MALTLPQFALLGQQPWMDAPMPDAGASLPAPAPAAPPVTSPPAGPSTLTQALLAAQSAGSQQSVLTEEDKRQAMFDSLGSMGMQLLAAAQPMSGAARGQLLAGAAGSMDMQKRMLNAAQTRLMMQSYQDASTRNAQREALKAAILSKGNLSDTDAAFAAMNPEGFVQAQFQRENQKNPMQLQIEGLRSLGLSDAQIREKVAPSRHYTNYGYVDVDTGQFHPYVDEGADSPDGPLPTDNLVTQGDVPQRPQLAFGSGGFFGRQVAAIRGVFGTETPLDREQMNNRTFLLNHKNALNSTLSSTFDGRETNYTRQRSNIIADPNAFWQSPAQATEDFKVAQKHINEQIALTERTFRYLERTNPKQAYKAKEKLERLQTLQRSNDLLLQNFQAGEEGVPPPSLQQGADAASRAVPPGRSGAGSSAVDSARRYLGE